MQAPHFAHVVPAGAHADPELVLLLVLDVLEELELDVLVWEPVELLVAPELVAPLLVLVVVVAPPAPSVTSWAPRTNARTRGAARAAPAREIRIEDRVAIQTLR